jgi:hypothetical protein
MLRQIAAIVTEIRTTLLRAGLTPPQIAYNIQKMELSKKEELEKAYAWLVGFKEVYIRDYEAARALQPDSTWEYYKSVGVKGTYEQNQLASTAKAIRERWDARPNVLKRKVKDAEQEPNQKVPKRVRVRPKQAGADGNHR